MVSASTRTHGLLKILVLVVTLAGLVGLYNLRLAEDALDLLPGTAVSNDLATLQKLGVINRVFVSLEVAGNTEGRSVEQIRTSLQESAEQVGSILAQNEDFSEVFYKLPKNYEFKIFNTISGLLPSLIDYDDIRSIEKRIAPDFLEKQLKENFLKLNSLAGIALAGKIRSDPLDLSTMVMKKFMVMRGGMKMKVRDGFFFSNDERSCLIWAESRIPLTNSVNAERINKQLQTAFAAGILPGVKAGVIGALPHTLANARAIKKDLQSLLPAAMLVLIAFLLYFLRSLRALLVVAIPFLAIPPAVTVTSLYFGTVSSLALGFGIVLLGIGVDFAVHIFLGCAENEEPGVIPDELQRSLLAAAVTTISVFIVLMFSAVPAHKQMAVLAVAGLSWALLLAWLIVPGIGAGYAKSKSRHAIMGWVGGIAGRSSSVGGRIAVAFWIVLVVSAICSVPGLHYNGDMKALDAPSQKVRDDETRFIETWGHGYDQAFLVSQGESRDDALNMNDRVYLALKNLDGLSGVQSIAPIVPGSGRQKSNIERWNSFWQEHLGQFSSDLEEASVAAGFTRTAFQPFLTSLVQKASVFAPDMMINGPLRPLMRSLFAESRDGGQESFLVATVVPDRDNTRALLAEVVKKVPEVQLISNSRWRAEVEKLLQHDILRLSLLAAVLVLLICLFFLRNPGRVFVALVPVITALATMMVYARFMGGELNIMHLLMGIMVIGISVDYGIFIVRSFETPVSATAVKAVTICAVSTLSGFGVLALADHPALKALGSTVLVGITASWAAALLVCPPLLKMIRRKA